VADAKHSETKNEDLISMMSDDMFTPLKIRKGISKLTLVRGIYRFMKMHGGLFDTSSSQTNLISSKVPWIPKVKNSQGNCSPPFHPNTR
jgi:hypothetical protein